MALAKKIKSQNSVELGYHRIAMISTEANQQVTILVRSYIDESGREYEKAYEHGEIQGEPSFQYNEGNYLSFDYDENMNVKNAYEWLKQRPEFEGAEDV